MFTGPNGKRYDDEEEIPSSDNERRGMAPQADLDKKDANRLPTQTPAQKPTQTADDVSKKKSYAKKYEESVAAVNDRHVKSGEKYDEMLAKLEKELDDLKGKREQGKREQGVSAALAGITDFVNGISDINAANHYVPYTPPKSTISAKSKERADKLRSLYDKDRAALMNYALQIKKLRGDDAKEAATERKLLLEEYKAQEKADRDYLANELKGKAAEAKARKDDAMKAYYTAKEEAVRAGMTNAEAESKAKQAKARAEAYRAQQQGDAANKDKVEVTTIDKDVKGNGVIVKTTEHKKPKPGYTYTESKKEATKSEKKKAY